MQCPNCEQTLVMTTREGIEIDYCPACRGVWLDRGELDKIIERSAAVYGAPARESAYPMDRERERHPAPERWYETDRPDRRRRYRPDDDDDRRRYGSSDRDGYGRRKRRSFLDDLFDVD